MSLVYRVSSRTSGLCRNPVRVKKEKAPHALALDDLVQACCTSEHLVGPPSLHSFRMDRILLRTQNLHKPALKNREWLKTLSGIPQVHTCPVFFTKRLGSFLPRRSVARQLECPFKQ